MNDLLPFNALLAYPLNTLRKVVFLGALGVFLGAIYPGFLQYQFHTLFAQDVLDKIPATAKAKIDKFGEDTKALESALAALARRIVEDASSSKEKEGTDILGFRNALAAYVETRKPPLHVAAFYLDYTMLVWPAFLASFFWLIFVFAPQVRYARPPLSYSLMFLATLILVRWPTWLRNTPILRDAERKVYADANWDVSPPTFVLQESIYLLVAWCLLELFLIWSCYLVLWRKEISGVRGAWAISAAQVYSLVQALSRQFVHWQVCSILLAIAFVTYTFFFWRYVIDFNDLRYLPAAIMIHSIWGACWVAISLPVAQTWYEWTLKQTMSPYLKSASREAGGDTSLVDFPASPIGFLNVITSVVVAALTFGSPLFKAMTLSH
jgi:hypothetical protein